MFGIHARNRRLVDDLAMEQSSCGSRYDLVPSLVSATEKRFHHRAKHRERPTLSNDERSTDSSDVRDRNLCGREILGND